MASICLTIILNAHYLQGGTPVASPPSTIFIFIAALAFVGLAVLLSLINKGLRSAGLKALVEMDGRYPGEVIVQNDGANFFGKKSLGYGQIRGNGQLILTGRKLLFRQIAPARWIEIPLDTIIRVENPVTFLGKSYGGKLLVVVFRDDSGEEDSIGWAVRELDKWTEMVGSAAGRK